MTVKELINLLSKVEEKDINVIIKCSDNCSSAIQGVDFQLSNDNNLALIIGQ